MKKIKVDLGKKSYYILIGSGLLSKAGGLLSDMRLDRAAYIITNRRIKSLYGKRLRRTLDSYGIEVRFCTVADSERSKSYATWCRVLTDIANFERGRGITVIALGGGVIGDLSGFVASVYRRGVPFVQIPTTLLAQVDSSIGGKVAIDIPCAKNLVGAFYQPRFVLSDIDTLQTLPKQEIMNGLAEIIKYAVILDRRLFSYLEKHISNILKLDVRSMEYVVARCSRLKAEVVSIDEKERLGYRSILNFGHTTGHALEAAVSYRKSVSHGEAVAVGMLVAFDISVSLGMATAGIAKRLRALVEKAGLPVNVKGVKLSKVVKAISHDKKILKGKKRWVLPIDIGHVTVCHNIPPEIIRKAITRRIVT